jgi:hypothetical protein
MVWWGTLVPSVSRRAVLGSAALGAVIAVGTIKRRDIYLALFGHHCRQPEADQEVPSSVRRTTERVLEADQGVAIVTSNDGLSDIDLDGLERSHRQFVTGVNFDESVLLVVQIEGNAASTVRFVGVERHDEEALYSYSCVTEDSPWKPAGVYTWLVSVRTDDEPTTARHRHQRPDETVTVESE